jgi:Fanconi anemia group M protein
MLLVEIGEGHGQFVHPNAVHGALAHISLDLGIPVMMTKNPEETAHFILAASKREHDMIERMASLAMSRSPEYQDERAIERAVSAALAEIKAIEMQENSITPLADRWIESHQQEYKNMLSAISGIGIKKAESLIESFGNISGVFAASIEQLAECEHIGNSSAVRIFEILHG